ncbi:iron-containing alcohol dehydrogenase family protein [Nocardioides rotundus]|uniref:iron-containing alcohol dehydrogenase family protein n=1 Tax=Nocardioides rotundus TaxID=1774216 RepID=UPI001CBB019C|nr:iron-containing alcohol dehydrogenase family protein [Nocardioides rotundus]UAL28632.1 iron-containing alcohol dehydrogenase family protein [Nocardioides rotundus]
MPVLSRMLPSPLFMDIRRGAVEGLDRLLHERFISTAGRVLVAVGPSQGAAIWSTLEPSLPEAEVISVNDASLAEAGRLQAALGEKGYDAVVAIGGGKTLDVAKYAATRAGLPMVAVATNLAHDGIASPVASLEHAHGKGSYGVAMPLAVVVDLDYVQAAPASLVRAGVGDVLSNLSAIADWDLAHRTRGEPIDGLAVAFARTGAEAVIARDDGIESEEFLVVLAEALVLSGMAMAVAGSSRPCSGACHELLHAVDQLFPGTAGHGELAGVGALFATMLRGEDRRFEEIAAALTRHELPRSHRDLGLTAEQFAAAVRLAPSTRPDRYTILEDLDLDDAAIAARVEELAERTA